MWYNWLSGIPGTRLGGRQLLQVYVIFSSKRSLKFPSTENIISKFISEPCILTTS